MPLKKKATRKRSVRKVAKKRRATHNPALKLTMRRKGTRLVHGYETTSRKKRRK